MNLEDLLRKKIKIVICNLFTHEVIRNSLKLVRAFQIDLKFGSVGF